MINTALNQQQEICWENLLKGQIAKGWAKYQEIYYRHESKDRKLNGSAWKSIVIKAIWKYIQNIWLDQCNQKHKNKSEENRERKKEELLIEIKKWYDEWQNKIRYMDRFLFHVSYDSRARQNSEQLRRWKINVKIYRRIYMKRRKRK